MYFKGICSWNASCTTLPDLVRDIQIQYIISVIEGICETAHPLLTNLLESVSVRCYNKTEHVRRETWQFLKSKWSRWYYKLWFWDVIYYVGLLQKYPKRIIWKQCLYNLPGQSVTAALEISSHSALLRLFVFGVIANSRMWTYQDKKKVCFEFFTMRTMGVCGCCPRSMIYAPHLLLILLFMQQVGRLVGEYFLKFCFANTNINIKVV